VKDMIDLKYIFKRKNYILIFIMKVHKLLIVILVC